MLALIFFTTGSTAPVLDLDSRVAVVPLKSNVSINGKIISRPGMAIIIEPHAAETAYAFPWRSRGLDGIWTSLDGVAQSANRHRLSLTAQEVNAQPPFLGESQPVVLVVDGEPTGEVLIFNERIPLAQLQLASRRSTALAMWVFVAAIFAAALTSISDLPGPAQQGG